MVPGTRIIQRREEFLVYCSLSLMLLAILLSGCSKPTPEQRLRIISDSIQVYPEKSSLYAERAFLENRLGRLDSSLTDVSRAIDLGDTNTQCYVLRSEILFNNNDFKGAIADLSILLQRGHKGSYGLRGWSYLASRDYNRAIADFLQADSVNHSQSHTLELSDCYIITGNYRSAISAWIRKLERAEADTGLKASVGSIAMNISALYSLLGSYGDALPYINKAIEHEPGNSMYYYYRGVINYKLHRFEDAKNDFVKSISLDHKASLPQYFLCILYERIGHTEQALTHLGNAIRKGFGFFDLVAQDPVLRRLRSGVRYKDLLRAYSSTKDINAQEDTLREILKRDKIIGDHEAAIVTERLDAIFYQPKRQKEFSKLVQLQTETAY